MDCRSCETHSDEYLRRMKDLVRQNGCRIKAVGEFGLDSDRKQYSSMWIQEKYFEKQFKLLEEFKLPMFMHVRGDQDCYSRFVEIVGEKKGLWRETGGVAHSFTGTADQLRMILEANLEVGVNGCSLKTEENLSVVRSIPVDKLHFETGNVLFSLGRFVRLADIVLMQIHSTRSLSINPNASRCSLVGRLSMVRY